MTHSAGTDYSVKVVMVLINYLTRSGFRDVERTIQENMIFYFGSNFCLRQMKASTFCNLDVSLDLHWSNFHLSYEVLLLKALI